MSFLSSSAAAFLFAHAALMMLFVPVCLALKIWTPPVSSLMIYRALFSSDKIKSISAVPLKSLPKWVPKMFVYLEDRQFYSHHGIDLEAIRTAYERNKRAGTMAFGGSTITQQLTRTLFLTPHKNYLRKYVEAILSLELDFLLPKDRIMELYLNHIEWGPGIFGIGTAAKVYFGRQADKLYVDQYRRLATIIPNPRGYSVYNFERHYGMRQRYDFLLRVFSS